MDDRLVTETLAGTYLAPLATLLRTAVRSGEPSSFLPIAAREVALLLRSPRCEAWLDADSGPAVAGLFDDPGIDTPSLDAGAIDEALRRGRSERDGWLLLALPGDPRPLGVLAVAKAADWSSDDALLAELAALIVSLGLQAAGTGKFDAKARDEFLALVGHDLRSPLSNVRVGAQLAVRNLEAGDQDSVRTALAIIEGQSARLLARLEALLDAVAADGRRLIRLEPLDLVAMAEAVVAPFRLAAEQSGVGTEFSVRSDPGLPAARGDTIQIGQVLEQLVDNAAKYASGGAVTVTVSGTGGNVRVDVCDNGPGIRPEEVERVFAPFGRGQAAAGREGYGLGLYLARNIISAHGGRLWIARTSRSGTCMAFTLPSAALEDG